MPTEPGVYLFLNEKRKVLYVGKARNLKNRVSSYFGAPASLGKKTKRMVSEAVTIRYIVVESELEALLLEANYIKKYNPWYNTRLTDGKSYPCIEITSKDPYPALLYARKRPDADDSIFYGPYPSGRDVKMVMKYMRRIFPYQSVRNHPKRYCLYYHLGMCPCPPMQPTAFKKEYKKTIHHIMQFLDGKKQTVVKELEKERDTASRDEDFERAKKLQQQLEAVMLITSRHHKPFEYELNPNLRSDIRAEELTAFQEILRQHAVPITTLQRIECYDISNFAGKQAVGSMVVFTNGEKDAKWYRRFKISKHIVGPNDFAMMAEVIRRRLQHDEWPYPDLFVVDGGKGQISAAYAVLKQNNVTIPVIGLAKRYETIITTDFQEIRLSKENKALQLLMRIRDEAHRFAVTYHRKVRSKVTFE